MNTQMMASKSFCFFAGALLLVAAILFAGCRHGKNKKPVEPTDAPSVTTQLPREQGAFSAWLEEAVPVGTEIEQAKEALASQGFKCENLNDAEGPTIYCTRSQQVDFWVSYQWRIVIQHMENRVTNTRGTVGLLGP